MYNNKIQEAMSLVSHKKVATSDKRFKLTSTFANRNHCFSMVSSRIRIIMGKFSLEYLR